MKLVKKRDHVMFYVKISQINEIWFGMKNKVKFYSHIKESIVQELHEGKIVCSNLCRKST